ncbi:MAG TPA: hypothetical protein VHT73_09225 [Thermodesulfobacteriota bacterium]|nr:hypothetical protein [Thermodesulfobacteriota bacterium]
MRNEGMGTMSPNGILMEINYLKAETERYSWLLGEELKRKIIKVLEEKEREVLENLIMWLA